jgi:K+-transporting ATPase KdpF subunit
MKKTHSQVATKVATQAVAQTLDDAIEIWSEWRGKKLPVRIFLVMCLNLIIAPAVQAATGNELSRSQSWSLGILGLVTIILSVYLFFVMFQSERF